MQLLGKVTAPILKASPPSVPETALRWLARHSFDWYLMSEDLPQPDSRVTIDGPDIVLHWKRTNTTAHRRLVAKARDVFRAAGYPFCECHRSCFGRAPWRTHPARCARGHPRRRNLAGEAKEPADPPRLPARRAPLHARPWRRDRGRAASGRSLCHHRVGTIAARTGRSGTVNRAPPPCGPVQPVQAPRRHGAATRNPVVDVERPAINRDEGSTAAFSKAQAGQILDAPPPDTLASLLDRAMDCRGHRHVNLASQHGAEVSLAAPVMLRVGRMSRGARF